MRTFSLIILAACFIAAVSAYPAENEPKPAPDAAVNPLAEHLEEETPETEGGRVKRQYGYGGNGGYGGGNNGGYGNRGNYGRGYGQGNRGGNGGNRGYGGNGGNRGYGNYGQGYGGNYGYGK